MTIDCLDADHYDFIIIKSGGDIGVLINKNANNAIQKYITEKNGFALKYKGGLPDDSDILVFSKQQQN